MMDVTDLGGFRITPRRNNRCAWVPTLLACALLLIGCSPESLGGGRMHSTALTARGGALTPIQIQSMLMSESDDLFSTVGDVSDRVIRRTARRETKVAACGLRLSTALGAVGAATERNAIVGYIDLMTLVTLQRMIMEGPRAATVFDQADLDDIIKTLAASQKEIWTQGEQIFDAKHIAELQQSILEWKNANPEQVNMAFVRLQEFASERQVPLVGPTGAGPGSIFGLLMMDPLAKLDPVTRQLEETRLAGERVAYWAQRLPIVAGWQLEWTLARMTELPPLDNLLKDIEQANRSAETLAASSARLAESYEQTLKLIPQEREAAIKQLDETTGRLGKELIQTTVDTFTAEREKAIEQLGKSFQDSLLAFSNELEKDFGTATSRSIDQAAKGVAEERQKLAEEIELKIKLLESLSDRLIYRGAIAGLVLVVAWGVIFLFVRHITAPRK